ncbi:MAG: helicase [Salinivirgaceae bacterium]|nr:MAG: helicase [Salinivirgaceae bacterium]
MDIENNTYIQTILAKFEVDSLTPMQEEAYNTIQSKSDVVLLSPTGTGKTLAYLLPIVEKLDPENTEIQMLILVPSRELAIQIEQVIRKMGSGLKINAVYGGRSGTLDKMELKHRPAILIGTPGRVADRFRRDNYTLDHIKTLVLDEFDKSLEVGFEKEMIEIIDALNNIQKRVLTSATTQPKIPPFVGLHKPIFIDYLKDETSQLTIKTIVSTEKDKLETLTKTLAHIGNQPGIIFCSFKDALQRVSNHLKENQIPHGCFHGDMEQLDRERALIKFRNGTHQLLVATDLAARGLDIPEIKFILHYHMPLHSREFTHRNGRTARMNRDGVAYVLNWQDDDLPDYLAEIEPENVSVNDLNASYDIKKKQWETLYITGGRKDKISKGDIAGLFLKQGQLTKEQVGIIEIYQNSAYVAVHANVAQQAIKKTNNSKLKKKKVRISIL